MRRAPRACLAWCFIAAPAVLRGQPNDAAMLQRADSITVGDYCRLAQRIVADPGVAARLGPNTSIARAHTEVICAPQFSTHSLLAVSGGKPAPLGTVARLDTNVERRSQVNVVQAMRKFGTLATDTALESAITTALGEAETRDFFRVAGTERQIRVRGTRDGALERLARYERKLGPTAPKLNGPEVFLNYLAQRFLPGFRPTPLGGPSPLEVVASYSPGYVTRTEGKSEPVPVSTSEFGLRFYLFGDAFGKTGTAGLLLPSYVTFGVLTASDRNGALVWPWRGRDHSGVFMSWGTIKIGYINRDNGRVLVSRQFQAVPFLF
jgi:hypothetical protein